MNEYRGGGPADPIAQLVDAVRGLTAEVKALREQLEGAHSVSGEGGAGGYPGGGAAKPVIDVEMLRRASVAEHIAVYLDPSTRYDTHLGDEVVNLFFEDALEILCSALETSLPDAEKKRLVAEAERRYPRALFR